MDESKTKDPFSSPEANDFRALTIFTAVTATSSEEMVVSYKECLKNHAASFGGHALDGCTEFVPSPATSTDPSSLKCAACGCHRNFHRRDPYNHSQHHHYLHSPIPISWNPPSSPPPPPKSVSSPVPYSYSSAPHVLLSPSAGLPGPLDNHEHNRKQPSFDPTALKKSEKTTMPMITRKSSRTNFTQEQKINMRAFAEKVGRKLNGCDEKLVREICSELGIDRGAFKVWIHNNKYPVNGKKEATDHLCLK